MKIKDEDIRRQATNLLMVERFQDFQYEIMRVLTWINRNSKWNINVVDAVIMKMIVDFLVDKYRGSEMWLAHLRGYLNSDITQLLDRLKLILINLFLFVRDMDKKYPDQKWRITYDNNSRIVVFNNKNSYKFLLGQDETYGCVLIDEMSGTVLRFLTDKKGCLTEDSMRELRNLLK